MENSNLLLSPLPGIFYQRLKLQRAAEVLFVLLFSQTEPRLQSSLVAGCRYSTGISLQTVYLVKLLCH